VAHAQQKRGDLTLFTAAGFALIIILSLTVLRYDLTPFQITATRMICLLSTIGFALTFVLWLTIWLSDAAASK
jgi:hypothetical protein